MNDNRPIRSVFPDGHRLAGRPAWILDGTMFPVIAGADEDTGTATLPARTGGARLAEIRAEQTANVALFDTARAAVLALAEIDGDLDESQRSAWETDNAEIDRLVARGAELEAEAAPLQERATRLEAVRAANLTAPGDGAAATGAARATFNVTTTTRDDIYDRSNLSVNNDADGASYRDRASMAIDSWRGTLPEWKASVQRLIDNAEYSKRDREIADHVLTYANPLYVRAFTSFLRGGPQSFQLLDRDEARFFAEANARAVNEGSISAGQAIVPPFLDPTLIMVNAGIVNPFRQLARVVSITTQTWKGVTTAGVTAEWTAEASEMTDASPTFLQPTITPTRADAYIEASFEAIEDTELATDVAMLFADARDRLEGAAFAVGTGSTQPFGVVTGLSVVTTSQTAAASNGRIQVVDIFNMDNNLPPRFRANANWAGAKGILNLIRQLATGPSQQQSAFWTSFGGGMPSQLIGYNVYEASGMQNYLSAATASTDNVLVLGDFSSGYVIVDRIGMSVAYNPLVVGPNRRPTGSVGWAAFWRTGGAIVNPAALQVLQV